MQLLLSFGKHAYSNDDGGDEPPANFEEQRRREAQHHLHILKVLPVTCNKFKNVDSTCMFSMSNTGSFDIISVLTVNIHDADAHDAGDDDQGEAGGVVVHQQQPVDPCLRTANRKSITTSQRLNPFTRKNAMEKLVLSFSHSF